MWTGRGTKGGEWENISVPPFVGTKLLKTNEKHIITTYFDEIMWIFVSI